MNPFLRWLRFNLVGALGTGVQLSALALFNRVAPGHPLYATAAAIELTLLHNFVWHLRYTWCDRSADSARLSSLARFHLSNGAVSMLGNLVLMRLLLHDTRLPLLAANSIAILCCSLLNFALSHAWTFAQRGHPIRG